MNPGMMNLGTMKFQMEYEELVDRYRTGRLYDTECIAFKRFSSDIVGENRKERRRIQRQIYKNNLKISMRERDQNEIYHYNWIHIRKNMTTAITMIESLYSNEEIYFKESDSNFYEYVDQKCIVINGVTRKHNIFEEMIEKWLKNGCIRAMNREYYRNIYPITPLIDFRKCSVFILSRRIPNIELSSPYYNLEFEMIEI